jgi:hypothetical protein
MLEKVIVVTLHKANLGLKGFDFVKIVGKVDES